MLSKNPILALVYNKFTTSHSGHAVYMFGSILNTLFNILFPKPQLVEELETLSTEDFRERLGTRPITPHHFTACTSYKNPCAKTAVWHIKYKGNRALTTLCGHLLYEELFQIVEETISFDHAQKVLLIPIPISKQRRRERGWNQSELLCKAILKAGGKDIAQYQPDLLVRVKHTERQTTLPRTKRLKNVAHTMSAQSKKILNGALVVLVDDVATTGATFKEAARALTEAGVWRVHCLAFAH